MRDRTYHEIREGDYLIRNRADMHDWTYFIVKLRYSPFTEMVSLASFRGKTNVENNDSWLFNIDEWALIR